MEKYDLKEFMTLLNSNLSSDEVVSKIMGKLEKNDGMKSENDYVEGFIGDSEVLVKQRVLDNYIVCDDTLVYSDLIDFLRNQDINNKFSKLLNGVLKFVGEYFKKDEESENYQLFSKYLEAYKNRRIKARDAYNAGVAKKIGDNEDIKYVTSITDIKGTGSAMCAEKNSLAANLLSFIGFEEVCLVNGTLNNLDKDSTEKHTFVCGRPKKDQEFRIIDLAQRVYGAKMTGIIDIHNQFGKQNTDNRNFTVMNGVGEKIKYNFPDMSRKRQIIFEEKEQDEK